MEKEYKIVPCVEVLDEEDKGKIYYPFNSTKEEVHEIAENIHGAISKGKALMIRTSENCYNIIGPKRAQDSRIVVRLMRKKNG